jgi:hypothetical protein
VIRSKWCIIELWVELCVCSCCAVAEVRRFQSSLLLVISLFKKYQALFRMHISALQAPASASSSSASSASAPGTPSPSGDVPVIEDFVFGFGWLLFITAKAEFRSGGVDDLHQLYLLLICVLHFILGALASPPASALQAPHAAAPANNTSDSLGTNSSATEHTYSDALLARLCTTAPAPTTTATTTTAASASSATSTTPSSTAGSSSSSTSSSVSAPTATAFVQGVVDDVLYREARAVQINKFRVFLRELCSRQILITSPPNSPSRPSAASTSASSSAAASEEPDYAQILCVQLLFRNATTLGQFYDQMVFVKSTNTLAAASSSGSSGAEGSAESAINSSSILEAGFVFDERLFLADAEWSVTPTRMSHASARLHHSRAPPTASNRRLLFTPAPAAQQQLWGPSFDSHALNGLLDSDPASGSGAGSSSGAAAGAAPPSGSTQPPLTPSRLAQTLYATPASAFELSVCILLKRRVSM